MEHPCLSPWKGAVAGGLIAFAWGGFSWMVLPFHGPVAVAPGRDLAVALAQALALQCFGAFWWTWVLGKIPGLTTLDAAKYGLMFGTCLATLGVLPGVVWNMLSPRDGVLTALDCVAAWTLASPVIGRWCRASVCALPARP